MINKLDKKVARVKRHRRVRKNVFGTPERPRLVVFRSEKHVYAQIVDDVAGHTIAAASTVEKDLKEKLASTSNKDAAAAVGELVAKRALDKGINTVVFDRGGYIFHGKVAALADAAREAGLQF